MILVENTITIEAPLEKVFSFLANPEKFPLWNYYIKSVRKISTGSYETGSRYHQVRKNDEQTFELTKFEKNKLIEFESIPGSSLQFKRKMIFSKINDQCLVEDFFNVNTGHPLFLQKLFSKKIKKAVKDNLGKLKQLLETGKTTLQDGRSVSI